MIVTWKGTSRYTQTELKGVEYVSSVEAIEILRKKLESQGIVDIEIKKSLFHTLTMDFFASRLKDKEILYLFETLLAVFKQDKAIDKGINLIIKQEKRMQRNRLFKRTVLMKACNEILEDMQAGAPFSEACANTRVFPDMIVQILRVAESANDLESAMNEIIAHYEQATTFTSQIKEAMYYPVLVLLLLVAVVFTLSFSVIPNVKNLLSDLIPNLPILTKIVFEGADILRFHYIEIIIGSIGLFLLVKFFLNKREFNLSRILIYKIPMFGKLWEYSDIYITLNNLALMAKIKTPLADSLRTAAQNTTSIPIAKSLTHMAEEIEKGKKFSIALEEDEFFRNHLLIATLVETGEKTDNLAQALKDLAEKYKKMTQSRLKLITTAVGPLMMIFIGLLLLLFIAAVFLPIIRIMRTII